jgi:hypothetical protein
MFKPLLSLISIVLLASAIQLSFRAAFADGASSQKRQKVIDFEDEVVEGVNKRPLDSLNEISERNRLKKKPHLYRKRGGFKTETSENLRVMRYIPQ